ncbi:MAG: DUF115 domain-containing protein [Alteromonadaceae bacterium TMED7]|nr:hypothetical protein [Alteromonadaceae bacterium]RPH16992.1 MAG: DUF115 domain-containing protein [Alteromonadaceae bacterium TMED7]|tara:strand:+ start:44454 stop:47948 length:3495 start_codon:yes stop_codon:yes gene_type:complete
MLKDILLHLHPDESEQIAVERRCSAAIDLNIRQNLNAFKRIIPSVYHRLQHEDNVSAAIMCNRFGELNIVEYQSGQVVYGLSPRREIDAQLSAFVKKPVHIQLFSAQADTSDSQNANYDLARICPVYAHRENNSPLPEKVSVLVVFGVGLGHHIETLIEDYDIDHLVLYEPSLDYFRASMSATSWKRILEVAGRKNCAIYFQIEEDGSNLYADIQELQEHTGIDELYLYRHYNTDVFNQVEQVLCQEGWSGLAEWSKPKTPSASIINYLPPWSPQIDPAGWHQDALNKARFERNLDAFKKFFPALYKEFKDYQPTHWAPLASAEAQVNLFHKASGNGFYGQSPQQEAEETFEYFATRPNKDGLVLGYKGKKLRSYTHYQMVRKVEDILADTSSEIGELPEKIKSMILFGLGAGYQLERLYDDYEIEKLFICEPNRDFFYASLYAIDWSGILDKIDKNKCRIYINIGDDGSHLIQDLLRQFHSVGPYILANTFFYQGYFNAALISAIVQLREQLQVIIAMGDYYDHSRFGITHTKWALEQGFPLLVNNAGQQLSWDERNIPVFMVGNGPSLDKLLPLLKEVQDKAIVISCGTALQTLHRNNIVPDFHAEIEANRSTYDWAMRVGDLDYVKQITLISCNGMHPDTCRLYKDTFLALKEGESATVAVTELYKKNKSFACLKFAYPTVANFVADFITQLGLKQVYLAGIDLGFIDPEKHHSQTSGYYRENGKEHYSYQENNDTSILIEGNFRPLVKTKYEFKVSKRVLEQAFGNAADVYNLNDGAKIKGASPLKEENVIVVTSAQAKSRCVAKIKSSCFKRLDPEGFTTKFNKRYQLPVLCQELEQFVQFVDKPIEKREQAEDFIDLQRDILVASFGKSRSLLFYTLNGTLNFINSALTKVLHVAHDETMLASFNALREVWLDTLNEILAMSRYDAEGLDYISSISHGRREYALELFLADKQIQQPADTAPVWQNAIADVCKRLSIQGNDEDKHALPVLFNEQIFTRPESQALRVVTDFSMLDKLRAEQPEFAVVYLPVDYAKPLVSFSCNPITALKVAIVSLPVLNGRFRLILPKLFIDESCQAITDSIDTDSLSDMLCYEATDYIALTTETLPLDEQVTVAGDRCRFIPRFTEQTLILENKPLSEQDEFKNILNSLLYKRAHNENI